ncbi:galectin-3b [Labrus bergylta]|uniref:galectin-3b n=1 Tax=Labrus bergylta TaxID=56723 RepID=UPI0033131831
MDLSDAIGGGSWPSAPGQPNNPSWPGGGGGGGGSWPGPPAAGQPNNPSWPGGGGGGSWPGPPAAGQPNNPSWPGGGGGGGGSWPGPPTQPNTQPFAPGPAAGQPNNPSWPGGGGGGGGSWPGPPTQPNTQQGGWNGPTPGPASGPAPGPAPGPAQQVLKVPYSQSLNHGVFDKLLITIMGTVNPNAKKITLDMHAGKDLAFHFNPRFNEGGKKVIVRNSRIYDKWGKEERDCPSFPFTQGQPFEMKILCTNAEFKVAVNKSHLLTFSHRVRDLSTIRSFNIYNDVTLSKVHVETLP